MLNFKPTDLDKQGQQLALHMPQGRMWSNCFNTNSTMGKVVAGLAVEMYRLEVLTEKISVEIDPQKASDLITDWMTQVSIPDECFFTGGTLEEQRTRIVQKLTSFGGVQKASDFERVAEIFGFTAIVTNGTANGIFPLVFPIRFFDSLPTAAHTIFVDLKERNDVFPLVFPMQFSSTLSGVIECLFNKLKPSNCQIIFRYGVNS